MCVGGASSPAWAKNVKWPLPYGKTISDLCQMAVEPKDIYGKDSCVERSLAASSLTKKQARSLQKGEVVTLDLTDEQHRRLVERLGASPDALPQAATQAPVMVSPPGSTLEDIQLKNDVRVLQTQVADIKTQTDTIGADVKTILERPAGGASASDLTLVYIGLGVIGVLVICFGIFQALKRSSKPFDENFNETGDAFKTPPIKSAEARKAAETLLAGIATSETTIERLTGNLETAGETEKALREELKAAQQRSKDLGEELDRALEDNKLSGKEIETLKNTLAEAREAESAANARVETAAATMDAAIDKSKDATARAAVVDEELVAAREELVLEPADGKK